MRSSKRRWKRPSLFEEFFFFFYPAILSQPSCCLSLPICCLNTMLLEAHQAWSVSCYRREVKRLFQLLSYWLRPPSGQARASVNPARNERRSLPSEEVSLWVYVTCSPNPANRKCMGWALCIWPYVCTGLVSMCVRSPPLHFTSLLSRFLLS